MTKLLLVIGSARQSRVADKIVEYVQRELAERSETEVTIADLKEIELPFFNNEVIPGSPDYSPTDEHVTKWSKLVAESDRVLFITPEYNHSLSAIQKNAIDSLYKEWHDKPVSATAYGWTGGSQSLVTFDVVMNNVKADIRTHAQLAFMKEINPDGSALDESKIRNNIKTQLDDLLN
jgi:NAD(P)H-dependent FMN reductase